ncbi:MAG: hypothetical protein JWM20_370 [Patescibacteria group bacterium]|nr:hypothetical protein [Patescibacteria group bacterium]
MAKKKILLIAASINTRQSLTGFIYPDLEKEVLAGNIVIHELREEQNLLKEMNKRYDYILVDGGIRFNSYFKPVKDHIGTFDMPTALYCFREALGPDMPGVPCLGEKGGEMFNTHVRRLINA